MTTRKKLIGVALPLDACWAAGTTALSPFEARRYSLRPAVLHAHRMNSAKPAGAGQPPNPMSFAMIRFMISFVPA